MGNWCEIAEARRDALEVKNIEIRRYKQRIAELEAQVAELLAVCEAFLLVMEWASCSYDFTGDSVAAQFHAKIESSMEMTRAAIAKARGE